MFNFQRIDDYVAKYGNHDHELITLDGVRPQLQCKFCLQTWLEQPKSKCLRVPIWNYPNTPEWAKSKNQLKQLGLETNRFMIGAWLKGRNRFVPLYDMRDAQPRKKKT